MASVNKVILVGNLGRDPEVKYTPSGVQIARFSVATTEKQKKGDTWEDKTEWHNIVVFGRVAEYAGEYLKKGYTVYVEGRLQTSSWEDESGMKKYRTEIIGSSVRTIAKRDSGEYKADVTMTEEPKSNEAEDDLPF